MTDERKNTDIENDMTERDTGGQRADDTGMAETEFAEVAGISDDPEGAVPIAAPPTAD
jgi:hypothetical protein